MTTIVPGENLRLLILLSEPRWATRHRLVTRLLETVPNHPVKHFVDITWRFFRAAINPPSQQRQQTPSECNGMSRQFRLPQLRQMIGFPEAPLDPAGKVALREI